MSITTEEFAMLQPGDIVRFVDKYGEYTSDRKDLGWACSLGREHVIARTNTTIRTRYPNCHFFRVYDSLFDFPCSIIDHIVRLSDSNAIIAADDSAIKSLFE